ncbi:MAG: hypothetical protein RML56_00145 [Burkholderiales bacterium]|nr:hypothetical protein [Burkholderiales bacterium]
MLPIELVVAPTPFQRDVSEMHERRLAGVIDRIGLFLDPIIAVTAPRDGFWTPNGGHRLAAVIVAARGARDHRARGAAARGGVADPCAQHRKRRTRCAERASEVLRIYRGLLEEDGARPESAFAFYLEEASLVTLGLAYEARPRFSGGAYHPVLRRLEAFVDEPLAKAFAAHERHAQLLLDADDRVSEVVAKLKARGLVSPYLRAFVVARINPLRWSRGEAAAARRGAPDDARARGALRRRKGTAGRPRRRGRPAGGAGAGLAGERPAEERAGDRKEREREAGDRHHAAPFGRVESDVALVRERAARGEVAHECVIDRDPDDRDPETDQCALDGGVHVGGFPRRRFWHRHRGPVACP